MGAFGGVEGVGAGDRLFSVGEAVAVIVIQPLEGTGVVTLLPYVAQAIAVIINGMGGLLCEQCNKDREG